MPLQIHLTGEGLDTLFTVWNNLSFQQFEMITDQKPDNLDIDPDNWVLKKLSLVQVENISPLQFEVSQNFPNPFNPETRILLFLPDPGVITFEVFNVLGEKVYEEINEYSAGYQTILWRGNNSHGIAVSSGMYIYRISSGPHVTVKKMILLR